MFKHPLQKEDLLTFHNAKTSLESIERCLTILVKDQVVCEQDGFYTLQKSEDWVERRKDANERAIKALPKAQRVGRRIAQLPFIKSVALSGTIAKGVMYEDSDVDYFIITKANRIWLAKFSLKLYKLFFHLNSRKNLCYNYLLSEEQLRIESQNIYTATEIITLIPVEMNATFVAFMDSNRWMKDFFPNATLASDQRELLMNKSKPFWSKWIENRLKGEKGDAWDNRIMNKIRKDYQQKYKEDLMNTAMKSTKHVSKTHPNDMQAKVLNRYESLLAEYLEKSKSIERNV